jgi:hypothetical protein
MIIPVALQPRIKVMQIIASAQVLGLAAFLAIAGILGQSRPPLPEGQVPIVTYMGLLMVVMVLPMSFLVPITITRKALMNIARPAPTSPSSEPSADTNVLGQLLAIRQTGTIIALALIEGGGFFCCVAYLVEQSPLALGGAIGCLIVMASRFPTFGNISAWLEQQMALITTIRQRPPV